MKKVSYGEFNKFLEDYPRKLEGSTIRVCDPHLVMFFDDSLGPRPGCAVATVNVGCDHPYYTDHLEDYVKKENGLIEFDWKIEEE